MTERDMRTILNAWDKWMNTVEGKQCGVFPAPVGGEDSTLTNALRDRLFQSFCAGLTCGFKDAIEAAAK